MLNSIKKEDDMRKIFLFNHYSLIFMVGLGLAAPELFGMAKLAGTKLGNAHAVSNASTLALLPCGGTVNWYNLSDTGCGAGQTNPGVVSNVINQNINIIGTNALVGGITVAALDCDITISVASGDAIITGSGNLCDGALADPARLYLYAAPGRTINFNLVNSLIFSGSANGSTPLDLLVTASGGGNIVFTLGDGQSVSFTAKDAQSGGTYFAEGMSTVNSPFVIFANSLVNTTGLPAKVIVGSGSLITFASQVGDPTATAELNFQSKSIAGASGLQLVIQNGGGVNVTGYPANLNLSNFGIGDINFSTQSGASANFVLTNISGGGAGSALEIINNNDMCPEGLLINPFCVPSVTANASLVGGIPGFVLTGPAANLIVGDQTYIAYIGTATNTCCDFNLPDSCGILEPMQRLRNGSALIIDSISDLDPVTITLLGSSAIYFLSGVDNCGGVSPDFTVNTSVLSECAGNILLDVEGPLEIFGSSPNETGINILSLEVTEIGCPVTIDSVAAANFPQRTFNRQPNGQYVQYNLGCFLINNIMTLNSSSLIHSDTIHPVYEHFNLGNPNIFSQPTYIGGDSYLFPCHLGRPRPTIEFVDSIYRVHTSVASTGVDFLFPNNQDGDNDSSIIFYSNGRCIDNGYGRNMILGTEDCFTFCDTGADGDSHLNVFQIDDQAVSFSINVSLLTAYNDDCITEGIPSIAAITGQNDVQTIYLNNASNFSIGTDGSVGIDRFGNPFTLNVPANVYIDGSCFSFETFGGSIALPQESGVTGEGGIFVDTLGSLSLLNNRIASFATMVTKSRGGIINLPSNQVFFAPTIGITEWQPLLSDPTQRIFVAPGQQLSDYSFDWGAAKKTFCCNDLIISPTCFIPYDTEVIPAPCACPAVTQNNLVNLPTIQGEVDQLQILRSRICDTAHLLVDGGFVRELVFLQGYNTGQAPTAFLVLQNDGLVGLGSAHKDVDSLEASIVLGINGVMLVANGNGNIELNEDVIINNVCHILSGTAFTASGGIFAISSTAPKELRIKSTGVLDLSQLTSPAQQLVISGQVKLVCEPGARIIMNGGLLVFSGQAQWFIEPEFDTQVAALPAVNVNSTDSVRVKLSGTGVINMIEDSSMFIPANAFFGIETYPTCSPITDFQWILNDNSSIQIGNSSEPGGAFQIGDTVVTSTAQSISVLLQLAGQGALFEINRQGFFGLSVGIVEKLAENQPNLWEVGCLSNLTTFSFEIGGPLGLGKTPGGTFYHNQIATGDFPEASLFAIGSEGSYTFQFNPANSIVLGGGNLVKVNCTENIDGVILPTSVIPTVTTFAGVQPGGVIQSGIMSGKLLLEDNAKPNPLLPGIGGVAGVTPQELFNYLNTLSNFSQFYPKANIGNNALHADNLGFVFGTTIRRDQLPEIRGKTGGIVSDQHSLEIGAVSIILAASGAISAIYEIQGTGNF